VCTAQRWLRRLDWHYQKKKSGMYLDGHEREDVVTYQKAFLECWAEYEKRMITYDKDGLVNTCPTGFTVPGGRFRLVLVTHDESTFYANDRHKTRWTHTSETPTPERKGEGASLMVSDFLVPEWGWLKDDEELVSRNNIINYHSLMKPVRPMLSSRPEKIVMAISPPMT